MFNPNLVNRSRWLHAVFIFLGDICRTSEADRDFYGEEKWRSTRGLEQDKTGPVFSFERIRAAALIHRVTSECILVPSGGPTNFAGQESSPTLSSVARFELEQLGVCPKQILEEPTARNTQEQIDACGAIAKSNKWSPRRIGIVAPGWQFPRICAMIMHSRGDGRYFSLAEITLLSMERILSERDSGWDARFVKWYETAQAREMFAKEALGTAQLLSGHQPKYPNPFRGFADPLD